MKDRIFTYEELEQITRDNFNADGYDLSGIIEFIFDITPGERISQSDVVKNIRIISGVGKGGYSYKYLESIWTNEKIEQFIEKFNSALNAHGATFIDRYPELADQLKAEGIYYRECAYGFLVWFVYYISGSPELIAEFAV